MYIYIIICAYMYQYIFRARLYDICMYLLFIANHAAHCIAPLLLRDA